MDYVLGWTRRLHVRHLQWLLLVAETGSLSEAARSGHTTQPGLSKWLAELETEVGTALFERHPRGLTPTPAGQLVVRYARRIVFAMRRAEADVEAVRDGGLRRVMLATSPAATVHLIPDAIARYMQREPDIQIGLREGTMNDLLVQLEHVQVDVAVGRLGGIEALPGLHYELLYNEPLVLVSRPGHPLAHLSVISWEQALDYRWIVWPTGTPIRASLEMELSQRGLKPRAYAVESSSMLANVALLRDSDLLLAASRHVADHFVRSGQMASLPLRMGNAGSLGMYWRDGTDSDPAISSLISSLREAAVALTGRG